ncbi:hypothetical protein KP509_10G040800 [Ceratopteris richardii]|nr:hypothetical protein KP509_10G040800 [Ceratopteris richardii]
MPPKSPTMLGPLSLGLCGNALIMRVGADARCFHHQSLPSEMSNFREHASCGKVLYAPPHTDSSCCAMSGRYSTIENQDVSLIKSNPVTTKRYGQTQQKKVGKTVISARNLFERSSFHFFELLFHYPFLTSNSVDLKIEIPSRRSLKDLANVLSQTAAGLAGVSVTWLLFALSRILWLDIPLNKHDITTLAMGFGFVSLSWAMKRVSDVFMRLADHNRLKSSNKKYILNLQKELQYITFSAILLVVVCFMGGS